MSIIAFTIGCFLTAAVIGVDRVRSYFFASLTFMFLHSYAFPNTDLEAFTALPVLTATWLFIFLGIVWIAQKFGGKVQSNAPVSKPKVSTKKVMETGDVIKTSTRGHVAQVGALRFGLDFREGEYSVKIIKQIEDDTYEGLFLSDGEETTIKCQVVVGSDRYSTFIKSLWPLNKNRYFSQNKFIDKILKDTDATVPELLKIHKANIIK